MTPVPEHIWLIAPGPYLSARVRYSWCAVLPYQKCLKRPGYPTFPALCVPAWLWTPYAALVCGVNLLQRVTGWARYFKAQVLARWVLCAPPTVRGVIVSDLRPLGLFEKREAA